MVFAYSSTAPYMLGCSACNWRLIIASDALAQASFLRSMPTGGFSRTRVSMAPSSLPVSALRLARRFVEYNQCFRGIRY